MSTFRIADLGAEYSWGSRVSGLGWHNITDPELRAELAELFRQRGFIIFEDMEPDSRLQVEVSTIFGPLKDHPTRNVPRASADVAEGVIDMHHKADLARNGDHGIVEKPDGTRVISFLPWHFDHTYNDELNYAGVLRAVISAPQGGRTGFADGIELYNALSPEIRARIEGLNAIYTLDVRLTQMRFGKNFKTFGDTERERANTEESARFPRAIHPMVWTRPDGQKVAHFCGFSAVGIEGHEDPEGNAIFDAAVHELNAKVNPYWHSWRPTDMVIWDNSRLLHAVEGCDPKYERRMHRTTIKGDYGLGRFEDGKKVGEVHREVAPLALPA